MFKEWHRKTRRKEVTIASGNCREFRPWLQYLSQCVPGNSPALFLSDSSSVPWQTSTAALVATICCSIASTMGIIMAVVAVLLIHMDKKAVMNIKPSINL